MAEDQKQSKPEGAADNAAASKKDQKQSKPEGGDASGKSPLEGVLDTIREDDGNLPDEFAIEDEVTQSICGVKKLGIYSVAEDGGKVKFKFIRPLEGIASMPICKATGKPHAPLYQVVRKNGSNEFACNECIGPASEYLSMKELPLS